MIASREQLRAQKAWDLVNKVPDSMLDQYASLANSAPVMILANGFGQTLAFFISKAKEKKNEYGMLYEHLNEWLSANVPWTQTGQQGDQLIEQVIHEQSQGYRMATEEALAFLAWVKRFANALKKGED